MKNVLASLLLISSVTASYAAETPAEKKTYELVLQNHQFSPDKLTVPANTPFVIKVKNLDQTPAEFESHDLKLEKIIGGGKEVTLNVRAQKPGTYTFFDEFNEKTTKGTLVVE